MKGKKLFFASVGRPTRIGILHRMLQTIVMTMGAFLTFNTSVAQEDSNTVIQMQNNIDWETKWQNVRKLKGSRPRVGVVLGGGGAKGASHIGVLKYLDELGIPVDYVAGTSMGSIIGGLYAMGYEADEMATLISNIPWDEFIGNKIDRSTMSFESRMRNSTTLMVIPFDLKNLGKNSSTESLISSLPAAYVNNSGLINLFNDLCIGYQDEMDFDDMPIPFACVATDLITGDEVVLRSGVVPQAMRASMAIPGVFTPIVIGDKVLVDGGLVNNFPADVLKAMGADIVIGIEVTEETTFTTEMLQSLPQLMSRLLTNVTNGKRKENRELCDIYIVPDVSGYGMLSFTPDAIETLVERGYAKAHEYSEALIALKEKMKGVVVPKRQELQVPRSINLMNSSVYIKDITIDGVDQNDIPWVVRKGGLKNGNYYTYNDIEKAINIYRGTSCFDNITYNITKLNPIRRRQITNLDTLLDSYKLTVKMTPAKPSLLGISTRYDTEEGAALMTSIGLNEKAFKGHKLNLTTKLSYSPMIGLKYTYSRRSVANFNVAYQYRDQHFRTMYDVDKTVNLHYQQNKISAYISQFHLLNLSISVGANYQKTHFDKTSLEKESKMDSIAFRKNSTIEPFMNVVYDNQDDAYFARHGVYTRLGSRYYFDPKEKNNSFDFGFTLLANVTPEEGKLTIIPQMYGRYVSSPHYYNQWILFGGEVAGRHFEEQMPFIGFSSVQDVTFDNYVNIVRCDVRYNPIGKHYLTATYNYLFNWSLLQRGSIGGMVVNGVHGAGLKYSYNSILGPVSLTLHWMRANDQSRLGAHFSLGYYF